MGDLFDSSGFTFGVFALINPCSFALLPSYLGLFLNLGEAGGNDSRGVLQVLNRSQLVSFFMAAGILTVFGFIGLVFSGLINLIGPYLPWFNMILGTGFIILGIAMLNSYELMLRIPKFNKGGKDGTLLGVYLYGISYAIAVLGCSSPLVLLALGTSTTSSQQFSTFLSFSIGMAVAISVVTLGVAFGRHAIVNSLRTVLPRVNHISAVILIIAGAYLAYYGWWSGNPISRPQGPVRPVENFQNSISAWLDADINPLSLLNEPINRSILFGVIFLTINLGLIMAGYLQRKSNLLNPNHE